MCGNAHLRSFVIFKHNHTHLLFYFIFLYILWRWSPTIKRRRRRNFCDVRVIFSPHLAHAGFIFLLIYIFHLPSSIKREFSSSPTRSSTISSYMLIFSSDAVLNLTELITLRSLRNSCSFLFDVYQWMIYDSIRVRIIFIFYTFSFTYTHTHVWRPSSIEWDCFNTMPGRLAEW